jgi:hypothetical protein
VSLPLSTGRVSSTAVDIDDWLDGLREMAKRGSDLRPVFKQFRGVIKEDLADHFDRSMGEDGKWAPRAPSTIERIMGLHGSTYKRGKRAGSPTKRGQKRLDNQLGKLKTSWSVRLTPRLLEFRSKAGLIADVQTRGGTVGKGSVIPARPFAYISEPVIEQFANVTADFVSKGW